VDVFEHYGAAAEQGDCGSCAKKDLRIAVFDLGEAFIKLCPSCLRDLAKCLEVSTYTARRLREIANG
jgi:hypothetical protein